MPALTAPAFLTQLKALARKEDLAKVQRSFWSEDNPYAADNRFLGVAHGKIFTLAKAFAAASLAEAEALLESPYYEARLGAVSILDFQARKKATPPAHRKALCELYLRRHDRINTWDLIDRAAPYVVGGYLLDQPRKVLYTLAKSKNPWERRTAIVATFAFLRVGDAEDTFRIGELLLHDGHEMVQKAVGSWLREAGKKDPAELRRLLDAHAATMPRVALRVATEKLDAKTRAHYLAMKT